MYTFQLENSATSLTLRPEGTAGVARAFVEHKMFGYADLPMKMYYVGPQCRHERPQKGRMRIFNQFGVEVIGAKSPLLDVETIAKNVGSPRTANIVMLGAAAPFIGIEYDKIADGIRRIFGRKGEEVELKAKQLVIDEIELLECHLDDPEPTIRIRVVCSKGTYIRALARDIGEALQSGAHLTELIRTRVGDVRLEDCLDPEHFKEWIDRQEIENDEDNN